MQLHTSQSLERVHGLDSSYPHRPLPAVAIVSLLVAAFSRIVRILGIWRTARKVRDERAALFALSSHTLRDIGISHRDLSSGREQFSGRRGS
jgi:uncharacterized protein YjiS (DUF1127 family)